MEQKLYKASNGRFYTGSLFYEVWRNSTEDFRRHDPVFSLYDDLVWQDKPLINCRATFIEEGDPTGYKWAIKYLGSWEHWKRLVDISWFKDALAVWQEELAAKLFAESIVNIISVSKSTENAAQSLNASKYLAERGWEKKGSRGRPKISQSHLDKQPTPDDLSGDIERIGLKVINGGK